MGDLTLAFITDKGLLGPTLIALASALAHMPPGQSVLFVGHDLDDHHWQQVQKVVMGYPATQLRPHHLDPAWLRDATSPKSFITTTALARMFLPRLTQGRTLYIDGDVLVVSDLSALKSVDLQGKPLGAVRDFVVQRRRRAGHDDRLAAIRDVMDPEPLSDYVNSGVLLLDCDAIRAEPALMAAMEDMAAAQGYETVDQDRLNLLFRGRVHHLNPAWNCSWGRLRQQHRLTSDLPREAEEALSIPPAILHFHGPNKPWKPLRLSSLSRGGLAVLRYRIAAKRIAGRFPFLSE